MNKIICFGDGYAANHIWPEWPAIIQALYPDIPVENHAAVGAGNEFISSAVIQAHLKDPAAFFLIQWAPPGRFDKLLEDNSWDNMIDADEVYHFNRVKLQDQHWWLSSASRQPDIQKYHQYYIQSQQAQLRTFNTVYLVSKLLSNHAINFTTHELNFTQEQWINLSAAPWIRQDMSTYSMLPKFTDIRQNQIQPSPPVHMAWVEEYLLPNIPIQPAADRLAELKRRINSYDWQAYDPDRQEIWHNLQNF